MRIGKKNNNENKLFENMHDHLRNSDSDSVWTRVWLVVFLKKIALSRNRTHGYYGPDWLESEKRHD